MNNRPQPSYRIAAFTLIELLTVITIIAILMGLLFPAIGVAKDQARKAEARTAVTSIVTAVKQYYTEYGKYPTGDISVDPGNPRDILYGNAPGVAGDESNANLFDILRNYNSTNIGQPNQYNPRAIVFFDGRSCSDSANPKSGIATQDAGSYVKKGAFVDPWGNEYGVAIDTSYDNQVTSLPYNDFKNAATTAPRTGVCAFSIGKDGQVGTKGDMMYRSTNTNSNSDDIVSWQ